MSESTRPLSKLVPGSAAVIVSLGGVRVFRRRLMELGLLPGTEVRVVNRAPLGDPIELEVRGCRLSIRAEEAAHVVVSGGETQRRLQVLQ